MVMVQKKKIYLMYWKQLKFFINEKGLDWVFSSFEEAEEAVIKIGSPKYKICLSLIGVDSRNPRRSIAASFWIPDSKEMYPQLKVKRPEIEAEMGRSLFWDSKVGRKSSWIRTSTSIDLANEKNWPASFEWFAENAQMIRDACARHL